MLILFDIDGTLLLKAASAHADALRAALRRVWHVRDPERARVDTAGRTDCEIARLMLLQLGVSAERIDGGMVDFKHVCALEYERRVPDDLSAHVAPGVPDLLAGLAEREGTTLALVTGNLQPVARLKLGAAGLGDFFPHGHGGFGSDSEDRSELPGIARRRAGTDGRAYPRERTVIVGDTPRDIACARADGVRCLAVATGPYRREDLGAADGVAAHARELGPLLDGLHAG
jgi:phosphoglycolate phosphatase-like HAD superfamily hydrolase